MALRKFPTKKEIACVAAFEDSDLREAKLMIALHDYMLEGGDPDRVDDLFRRARLVAEAVISDDLALAGIVPNL